MKANGLEVKQPARDDYANVRTPGGGDPGASTGICTHLSAHDCGIHDCVRKCSKLSGYYG